MGEKLPSRTEGRGWKIAHLHFERFWAQKGATRLPKIDQKSMKKSMQKSMGNSVGFWQSLGSVFG